VIARSGISREGEDDWGKIKEPFTRTVNLLSV